jgi:DNA adenine methylase
MILNPPLKWAGGKRWLLPYIQPIWGRHAQRRYVEPFCGGLAIPLGLQPDRAVLNDVNPHLINFYRQIRSGLAITIETENDRKLFNRQRDRFNHLIRAGRFQTSEAAQLFYFLNRTCFNGLCRFNSTGEFNVPFGRYRTINYATDFHSYRELFRRWSFACNDLDRISIDADDFIYADPPYDVEFTTYSAGGFSWDDQVRTAELLAQHAGPVLLSNQATTRIKRLYRQLGYKLRFLSRNV